MPKSMKLLGESLELFRVIGFFPLNWAFHDDRLFRAKKMFQKVIYKKKLKVIYNSFASIDEISPKEFKPFYFQR